MSIDRSTDDLDRGESNDTVLTELVRGALFSAQLELETMIERTAMSPYISEKRDYVVQFCDSDGRALTLTNHTGANMLDIVLRTFPRDTIRPGDMFWFNDCYASGGAVSHLPDMAFICPSFSDGALIGFSVLFGHFWDIGGMRPGSLPPDATEIYQEGIMIPPVRIVSEGRWNGDVLRIFVRNSRFPQMMEGDVQALTAAARVGERRLSELARRHGVETLRGAFATIRNETRTALRSTALERIPEGTYEFSDTIDGVSENGTWINLRLTRTGDRLVLDATECDDQVTGPFNYIMHESVPNLMLAFQLSGGTGPLVLNAGGEHIFDEVLLREGSILRPRFPAPIGSRSHTMLRTSAAVQGLLACATGGQVPAASATYGVITLRYFDTDKHKWVMFSDGLAVGHGGRPFADGHDGVYFIGQQNFPVEYVEERYPLEFVEYGVRTDSGGPGRHRGGAGVVREFVFTGDEAAITTRLDNVRFPTWGVYGGHGGRAGRVILNPGSAEEKVLPPIADGIPLRAGDRIRFETTGGGGWGHPFDRPVQAVRSDVLNGFVTVAGARADYGVALTEMLAVDDAATAQLRADRGEPARMFHRTKYVDSLRPDESAVFSGA